jgi:SPP1 family predicted phage head-tail adaptor
MKAGRLRDRVTIEAKTSVPNGQGGRVTDWAPVFKKVPAEVVAMTGDEALRMGVERATSTYRVTVRKRTGLTSAHRLSWDGLALDIRSVLPDPRDPLQGLLLICEAGQLGR